MNALTRALYPYRQHEREYRKELVILQREIEFLEDFIDESPRNRSLSPVVEDLEERVIMIWKALQEPVLPPLPDTMRNPFTRPRTPAENEYIRELIKRCEERTKHAKKQ
jgi:hypothetical protein